MIVQSIGYIVGIIFIQNYKEEDFIEDNDDREVTKEDYDNFKTTITIIFVLGLIFTIVFGVFLIRHLKASIMITE